MGSKMEELAVLNSIIDQEEKLLKQLEERLFLEQIRLASLKATKERILRREVISDGE